MAQIASSPNQFDIVVFITDGGPTVYGPGAEGPGNFTRFREVENGVFSANALKAKGSRIIAFGVGDGVSGAAAASNLIAPDARADAEQRLLPDNELRAGRRRPAGDRTRQLRRVDLGHQAGHPPRTEPSPDPPTPADGHTPQAPPPASRSTPRGQTSLELGPELQPGFPGGTADATVTIDETLQGGYSVVPNAEGQYATCTRPRHQSAGTWLHQRHVPDAVQRHWRLSCTRSVASSTPCPEPASHADREQDLVDHVERLDYDLPKRS